MVIRSLVPLLLVLLVSSTPAHATLSLSTLPGFLGDALFSAGVESVEDALRGGEVTRAGWELPEFREFTSIGVTVPGERGAKNTWLHPGTARFYDFLEYLVFKKPGLLRATLALNCSEQEIAVAPGKDAPKMTRREYAEGLFDNYRIPREIFWLGAQESGFQDRALSPVGAYGVWQFMPATGTTYGAPGSKRADYLVATVAAAKYLTKLHVQFGDWGLAMAAYNSGEGNVSKGANRIIVAAAKKGQAVNPDYWDVYSHLPSETRDYVPAILAWTRIALDPARFGIKPDGKACKQFTGRERR